MKLPALLAGVLVTAILAVPLLAQAPPDSGRASEPLRVYVDCQRLYCDLDFLRTEIAWVSYVRDRTVADAHVLITRQGTGGGGNEYTLTFFGQRQFAGLSDTLRYVAPPAASDDAVRRGLAGMLKLGLVRFAARSELASRVQISVSAPSAQAAPAAPLHDPWNFWVVRTRANGYFNGQQQSRSVSSYGTLTASRVTAAWKTTLGLSGSYGEDRFTFSDGRQFSSYQNSYGANALMVKSLSDHWSAGMTAAASSSTFLNQRLAVSAAPAVEYNYFPYSQSTRRSLLARYAVGARAFRYKEETLFDRIAETRSYQELVLALEARQPWGSVSTTVSGSQYFFDPGKFSLSLFNSADIRLVKGLSFNLSGAVSLVRDQLYIPKVGATDEEVLLQRRQLATSYRYFASAGLSYTFGSIYNNVVNPRFGGNGGFFFF